jgi:hypothetical protein
VDFNKIIARAKAMLVSPRTEWPIIAAEPATVGGLFTGYILILAAIPPIAQFLSSAMIGSSLGILGSYRTPFGWALEFALMMYVLSLIGIYIASLVINALAPSFSGEKNPVQALKVVAYAYTVYWVASIATIVPFLGWLVVLAAAIYSIYLLNMGLPYTMKCPPEKSVGYTALTIVVLIVIYILIGVAMRLTGFNPYGSMFTSDASPAFGRHGTYAAGTTGAAVQAWAKSVDQASKQMDAAQKSGDSSAQANAMGAMLGAALGSGGKVESLAPDRIKPFIPDTLDGLKRTQIQVQRSGVAGMQLSSGTATY